MIFTREELKLALRDKRIDHYELPDKLMHYKAVYRQSIETITRDRRVLHALRKEIKRINLEETGDIMETLKKMMSMLNNRLWVGNSTLSLTGENSDLLSIDFLEEYLPFLGVSFNNPIDLSLQTYTELMQRREDET